jgi:predicted membrane GTPase involved in stress response
LLTRAAASPRFGRKAHGLEPAIELIADGEAVEVTPKSVRLCKRVLWAQQR